MDDAISAELEERASTGGPFKSEDGAHVDAAWIRDAVVTGKIPGSGTEVHAKGIRISGTEDALVVIDGVLDFEHARLKVPLLLDYVRADQPIVLEQATGGWISLTHSHLGAVAAAQLKLDHSLDLSGSTVRDLEPLSRHIAPDTSLCTLRTQRGIVTT